LILIGVFDLEHRKTGQIDNGRIDTHPHPVKQSHLLICKDQYVPWRKIAMTDG